jgi:hypothetical protein
MINLLASLVFAGTSASTLFLRMEAGVIDAF